MCVVCCTLTHQKGSIFFVDALQSALFRCAVNVAASTAAPLLLLLLLLLLPTVLCACTVMITLLVVVITREFESRLKSSGRVTIRKSF